MRVALVIGLLVVASACRPQGYVAPPVEPEPRIPDESYEVEELAHQALYGSEVAAPSIMAAPQDAQASQTGLKWKQLRPGTGDRTPRTGDSVVVHFTGWDAKGERFDSSVARGTPDRYRLDELPAGWREGLEQMVVGEKRRLWIPAELGFGSVATPGRPAGALVIDVELLDVMEPLAVPEVPEDLAEPPPDAQQTASGLRYKVLEPGTGKQPPGPHDQVLVHYTGWSLDGNMFDSSVARGQPVAFGVDEVIAGWTEMLQLMVEGERVRVWIPAQLAYGDEPARPGAPAGPLVFEIELIEVQR